MDVETMFTVLFLLGCVAMFVFVVLVLIDIVFNPGPGEDEDITSPVQDAAHTALREFPDEHSR